MTARLFIIGRNKEFSPDAVQRLGSVYGLSPGSLLPGRQLPYTAPHSGVLPGSAPNRLGHCSFSGGGDFCQVAPRRSEKNDTWKAQPQEYDSPNTAQHRGLRSVPNKAEADYSVLEFIFWVCLLGAFYVAVKLVHV